MLVSAKEMMTKALAGKYACLLYTSDAADE